MTTTQLILGAIVTVAGFAFWLWKRYFSVSAEIAQLKKRIREIENEQQDALENNDVLVFNYLDDERLQLGEEIRRLRG